MPKSVVNQRVMDLLSMVGLNSYERKLFVTLLSKGSSNAGQLAELSGVPRSRTYDVLESLADKGFVVVQNSKPIKYVAVPPREALERAKNKHKEDYETATDRIERAKKSDSLKELEELFKTGVETVSSSDLTGSLKGRHAMHQQLESMFKKASSHVYILTSEKGFEEIAANHGNLLKNASKRGVRVRIAAPITSAGAQTAQAIRSYAEVRNTKGRKNLEGRFAIADGKEALVALTHDEKTHPTQDTHIWSQSENLAGQLLQPMFEAIWKDAEAVN
ncbi:MAG: TrmB family transcriptional regulator [Candidatus Aenigmatarchaeota archaeon]|nr:MAG: TrmB family transcriptional regulator [Candidatus Aenigmarchaeota archaeon]